MFRFFYFSCVNRPHMCLFISQIEKLFIYIFTNKMIFFAAHNSAAHNT